MISLCSENTYGYQSCSWVGQSSAKRGLILWDVKSEAESEVPAIQCKELWLESRLWYHIASAWLVCVLVVPLLFPLSIWVDWAGVSHCRVSGLLVLHFWAFCQGLELFWSLSRRTITVRSPIHAFHLLLFPWYDIVAISKKHCFLEKLQFSS